MNFFKNFKYGLNKHSTELLTIAGIIGFGTTVGLSIRAYETCKNNIYARAEELDMAVDDLPIKEVINVSWKPMILPVLTFATSTACIIFAEKKILKRNAALAIAYKGAEAALTEFKSQAKEELGEEKVKQIEEKVVEKHIQETKPDNIISTGHGNDLIYDYMTGRMFYSNRNYVDHCINTVNKQMLNERYVTLSDLYDQLDWPHTGLSDMIGWNVDKHGLITPSWTSTDIDGKLCWSLTFYVLPSEYFIDRY